MSDVSNNASKLLVKVVSAIVIIAVILMIVMNGLNAISPEIRLVIDLILLVLALHLAQLLDDIGDLAPVFIQQLQEKQMQSLGEL